ncbi:MAG: DNA polymerase III subunit alpha [Bacteroidales bacterium]|nr:DNA polymerase III subunit alpha [Candidatus Physcousia equi]
MQDFVHIHVHTDYSLLDGMSKIPKMVDKAVENGMRGIAVTDHGNMLGIKELFDYCNKVNKGRKKEGLEPFKPIFGCEMYVARRGDKTLTKGKQDQSGWHLVVLAKNEVGYRNLINLVSRSWVDGYYMRPRTDHKDLEQFHEGLIICSACIGGEVPKKILSGNVQAAEDAILWFKKIWGDDYYLEIQRHEVKNPTLRANRETYELQKQCNPVIVELARKHQVKLVCTNDCHFVDEEDGDAHEILLCLATGKKLDDPHMLYTKQEWFKTREEMNEIFSDIPDALANTCEILDKVEFYNIESDPIMPFYPIPGEFGTEEQWRQTFGEADLLREFTSDENGANPMPEEEGRKKIQKLGGFEKLYRIKFEADYLGKLGYEGASRLYGTGYAEIPNDHALQPDELSAWAAKHGIAKEVDDRIRFELHIMKTMGFPGYFLIVQDFINSARQELGVWVGPGRGSAAGSVVAYCLGITKIDPMRYDLLFERFLNPDRISLPDIDTDFDDDGRGKVLQWVMDKYGHENCAHIITYGSMAAKNAIKDVARVLGYPLSQTNALCKAMPDRLPDGMKPKLVNYLKHTPELQQAAASKDEREANTIKYALRLEGTTRNTGIHACGFIICRDPISQHVPVSTADDPDFANVKTPVTQYDGHVIESTGLIKMDFLGLKTLSQMKEACRVIKEAHGVDIDLDTIPIDDPLTFKLYQEGRTVGTFQFESAGMQKYLKELHPTVFEDLIAMNALYRPGPMDYIPSFIRRKNGLEPITYDLPVMEKYLKDTYGITVYQEQVMLLSRLLANFTRGESDALRKAMGKKKKDIVDAMKPKFIEGGTKNGHDAKILEKIWSDWEKFASYAFNKSHAACYSWVSYQTAYLKAHYPSEFMAALMTRAKDDIKEITKLQAECKALKIEVLGPDVNESYCDFGVNKKGQIRYGLTAIKGLGAQAANVIVAERAKGGEYTHIFDFLQRVPMSAVKSSGMKVLALSGAFDTFHNQITREQFLFVSPKGDAFIDQLVRFSNQYQQTMQEAQYSLFGMDAVEVNTPRIPEAESWSDIERLNKERELVGIYLSAHPLDEYKVILNGLCNLHMEQMANLTAFANQEVRLGGIVTNLRTGMTKKGNQFGIATIEDYSGSGEIALFGNEWVNWSKYMVVGYSLYITARVQPKQYRPEELELHITQISLLNDVKDTLVQGLTLTIPLGTASTDQEQDFSTSSADPDADPDDMPDTVSTSGAPTIGSPVLNNNLVASLSEYVRKHPGRVALRFRFIDTDGRQQLAMRSPTSISITSDFIRILDETDGLSYAIE